MCQYGQGVFLCFVSRCLSQRCPFNCQDTPKWTCTPANTFFLFIHQQIEGHRVFASWDICKCDLGGGGRERVFSGPECSRPGLQDGSNVLEEPSRFYCAFMRARKSFNFLSFNPAILQCTTELCKPVTKPITNRLKLDMAPSCKGMSLLFYVTQQDGNNGE